MGKTEKNFFILSFHLLFTAECATIPIEKGLPFFQRRSVQKMLSDRLTEVRRSLFYKTLFFQQGNNCYNQHSQLYTSQDKLYAYLHQFKICNHSITPLQREWPTAKRQSFILSISYFCWIFSKIFHLLFMPEYARIPIEKGLSFFERRSVRKLVMTV